MFPEKCRRRNDRILIKHSNEFKYQSIPKILDLTERERIIDSFEDNLADYKK